MQNNNSLRIQRIQGKYRLTGRNKQVSGNRTNTEQLWQMMQSSRTVNKKVYKETE